MGKQAGTTAVQLSGKKELAKLIAAKIAEGVKDVATHADGSEEIKKLIKKASKAIAAKLWKKTKAEDKAATNDQSAPKPLTKPVKTASKSPKKKAVKAAKPSIPKKATATSAVKKAAKKISKSAKPVAVNKTVA